MPRAEIWWVPDFLSGEEADHYESQLRDSLQWEQGQVRMFGKWVLEPRLTAWYGDPGASYTYAGKQQKPLPWNPGLYDLKLRIESQCGISFNSVLANYYRSGQDSMGWHSDDEPELGKHPVIASLNLGATRRFQFRLKSDKAHKVELQLSHGGLLLMAGDTQHHWQHQVPKTSRPIAERINLTFRMVYHQSATE